MSQTTMNNESNEQCGGTSVGRTLRLRASIVYRCWYIRFISSPTILATARAHQRCRRSLAIQQSDYYYKVVLPHHCRPPSRFLPPGTSVHRRINIMPARRNSFSIVAIEISMKELFLRRGKKLLCNDAVESRNHDERIVYIFNDPSTVTENQLQTTVPHDSHSILVYDSSPPPTAPRKALLPPRTPAARPAPRADRATAEASRRSR